MISISIRNLTKKYKTLTAVDNLSLDIYEGEFLALLGFNGAGKTTTIKMLCGLITPTSGDALIYDKSIVKNMSEIKSLVNISPQETAIAPNLTVFENLVFIAEVYGYKKEDAKTKAEELMKKFNIEDRRTSKAKKLSGGLMRRLSVAMALISEPKILFLDEPTLGLDVRARRELWHLLTELKGNTTVILTTHYLDEVEALADTIAIIDKGKLKIKGTLEELKRETKLDKLEEIFLSLTEGDITLWKRGFMPNVI